MNKTNLINFSLVIGTFLGITLALLSSINETNFDNSDRWVAKVGEVEISREKYLLQLDGLNLDKSMPLNQEDKDFVLERMIEEELLIQRAKDLGMFSSNTMIRGTIIQQMINLVISENSFEIISKEELKLFYEGNKGFFTSADRLRVTQIYFSNKNGSSKEKANKAYSDLLAGKEIEEIIKRADNSPLDIPDTLMTLAKVREYIGPSLMQVAKTLKIGEFTSPKKVIGGHKIILLLERTDSLPPDFELIKEWVKSEYKKRRDDQALRGYLEKLKKRYEVNRHPEI